MRLDQDLIFSESEGDAWFQRNAEKLSEAGRGDPVLRMIQQLPPERLTGIRSVCDVGCSNGERLARFAKELPAVERLCGYDASASAVESGAAHHPNLDLRHGLADEPPFEGPFDLVTISFVLHWVDRRRLARAVAALDGLVADGGLLVIADFLPDRPCARRYHHREDVDLFTYKQDYAAVFSGFGLYREIARTVYSHDDTRFDVAPSDDQDRAMCAMFVKQLDYPVVTG